MYKIIDLGSHVPTTGERRVQILCPDLVKTASSDIQTYWDGIQQSDEYSYLWVIGVSAQEYYGCNNNGDAFSEADLKKTHTDFTQSAYIFLHHVNKDPAKSIGKPVYSWYNDAMHRVELILRIEKSMQGASDIVQRIQRGDPIYVSIGCRVEYDVCSICSNKAKTRQDYCDHLRFNMKKILPDGKQVFCYNHNPKFFDISIVRKPADPTAFTLDKMASAMDESQPETLSASLGAASEDYSVKLAALDKLSDLVKRLNGQIVDAKDDPIRQIEQNGFKDFEYPEMPYDTLDRMGVSPGGLVTSLTSLGAPLTLSDAAWMARRHYGLHCPLGSLLSLLPMALRILRDKPDLFDGASCELPTDYAGELEHPAHRALIIRVVRPVARMRITIIRSLGDDDAFEKLGSAFGEPDEVPAYYGRSAWEVLKNHVSNSGRNFSTMEFTDQYGHTIKTTPYHLRQASMVGVAENATKKMAGAALALGALSAAMIEPNLLKKVLYASALGVPAAAMMFSDRGERVEISSSGEEVPMQTITHAWKQEKKAALTGVPRIGTLAGMALPGALALDYAYNRWRYGPYAEPEGVLDRAGKAVVDHPLTSVVVGGLLGSRLPV